MPRRVHLHEGTDGEAGGPWRERCGRELGVGLQERLDDSFVLLVLDGARGVDEPSAGPDEGVQSLEEGSLPCGVTLQVIRPNAPADVGTTPQRPETTAGSVHQDGVEGLAIRGIRYWTLIGSTTSVTPWFSMLLSPSSTFSSKVNPY